MPMAISFVAAGVIWNFMYDFAQTSARSTPGSALSGSSRSRG